ncbi:MAG: glutamine-hydrolyzing GMP synthase [SAR324 cluster bacterium]|uniref:GMP synthase [glutamine-hydrolyzing] n=1 Tax=SAR324 cluster bacterium TaxID=2024889 RepID=A0A2A4SV68_9DELT|nr:MAG: glutamine-hydrolyzing GMP synthase [SAR324 cluster bacterium]
MGLSGSSPLGPLAGTFFLSPPFFQLLQHLDDEMIVILDFGSQFTQLIARRIREQKVYCEIHPCTVPLEKIKALQPQGIILSGGPSSVLGENAPTIDPELFDWGVPVLGICYGQQLMVSLLGGKVENSDHSEYGRTGIHIDHEGTFFQDVPQEKEVVVWMSHGDRVISIPQGFEVLATSQSSPYAAIAHLEKKFFGIQFHPEVVHTNYGTQVLKNFIFEICGCEGSWSMQSFMETQLEQIRKRVGKEKVLCALSGGVDSSVVAALLHKAIGDQLVCVFVDNGLLRQGEADRVIKLFRTHLHVNLIHVDAKRLFLDKLIGVTDPEKKRKIIGNTFIEIFDAESTKLNEVRFLAQGTLYPDVIESESFKGPSAVIKSHHNVGGLPEDMKMELVEPLRELFKDEVRELGLTLGLDEDVVFRHPFPGPGLGIRILGEITDERVETLQKADKIVMTEIKKAGWYRKVWQSFAVLLPVKSVGVMGDCRTYEWTVALRCVDSKDAMTADWTHLPYDLLGRISNRIVNEVPKVNRVVYDITSKPPGTIEWE